MYVYVSPGKQKVSRVVWMKYAFLWQNVCATFKELKRTRLTSTVLIMMKLQSVQLGRVWSCPESGRTLDVGQGVKQQGQHRLVPILQVLSTDDPLETVAQRRVSDCHHMHGCARTGIPP